jgi:hypothetical protein
MNWSVGKHPSLTRAIPRRRMILWEGSDGRASQALTRGMRPDHSLGLSVAVVGSAVDASTQWTRNPSAPVYGAPDR